MQDFNDDGQQEALVIVGYGAADKGRLNARLFAWQGEAWRFEGSLHAMASFSEWEDSIRAGQVRLVAPDWKDVELNGQRKSIIPSDD